MQYTYLDRLNGLFEYDEMDDTSSHNFNQGEAPPTLHPENVRASGLPYMCLVGTPGVPCFTTPNHAQHLRRHSYMLKRRIRMEWDQIL